MRAIWLNNCKHTPHWATVRIVAVQKHTARIQLRRSDGRVVTRLTKLTRLRVLP